MASPQLGDFLKAIASNELTVYDIAPNLNQYGDLTRLTGIDRAIQQVLAALLISTRSYIFDPELCCDIKELVFAPNDVPSKLALTNIITTTLNRYVDQSEIDVSFEITRHVEGNKDKGFAVDFTLKSSASPPQHKTVTVRLSKHLFN